MHWCRAKLVLHRWCSMEWFPSSLIVLLWSNFTINEWKWLSNIIICLFSLFLLFQQYILFDFFFKFQPLFVLGLKLVESKYQFIVLFLKLLTVFNKLIFVVSFYMVPFLNIWNQRCCNILLKLNPLRRD
jgi:hypothetical protein